MTKKIFISYAKKDAREIALALADSLAAVDGLDVWIDRSLRAGRSWELQIQRQIDDCDVMIVLYSPDINRHKLGQPESYVLTEIAYAKYTAKRPIIPVMAIQTDPPMSLTMEHYIDFTISGAIGELVGALCAELDVSPVQIVSTNKVTDNSSEAIRAIIGDPFEWCEVPDGAFIFGGEKKYDAPRQIVSLPDFAVAKYPITYGQFQKFILNGGFRDNRWWKGLANKPDEVGRQRWKIENHPQVNVSWYDAIAFCRWLSSSLEGEYFVDRPSKWAVRLPTEFEWQKAARGQDGREYPWGNVFDETKCNSEESGNAQTTPVTKYPNGVSPYGVFDMSGNVAEWCLTDPAMPTFEADWTRISGIRPRVFHGGGWCYNQGRARITFRSSNHPSMRLDSRGFRIMRPL